MLAIVRTGSRDETIMKSAFSPQGAYSLTPGPLYPTPIHLYVLVVLNSPHAPLGLRAIWLQMGHRREPTQHWARLWIWTEKQREGKAVLAASYRWAKYPPPLHRLARRTRIIASPLGPTSIFALACSCDGYGLSDS